MVRVLTPAIFLAALLLSPAVQAADASTADAVATDAKPAAKIPVKVSVEAPSDVPEAVEDAKSIFASFKGGKYREGIAGVIVVLLFLWRRFGAGFIIGKLSPWTVGLVTVALGFAGSVPEALMADPFGWKTFIWTGILTSAEAMLFWQMIGKRVLPKLFAKDESKDEPKEDATP